MPETQIPLFVFSSSKISQGTQLPFWRAKQSATLQNEILVTTFIMNVLPFIPSIEVIPVDLGIKQLVTFMVVRDYPLKLCGTREVQLR